MKKILNILMLALTVLWFSSCEEDIDKLNVNETTPIVLSDLFINQIELDPINVNNPIVTFNWSEANYGQQTTVTYKLEFSSDPAFTNVITAASLNSLNAITLSVAELNSAAGSAGLPPFVWNDLYARVKSSIGSQDALTEVSNVISFSVYSYFNYAFKDYYLVGDATQPGWSNDNNNPPLFRDASNINEYNFVGYYAAGQFKVLEIKGQWQPQWGTNDGTSIDVNPGGGSDPGTFPNNNNNIATAGYYKFTINFSSNTYSFEPYSATGATIYSTMTIQGSASASTSMTQSPFDSHLWYVSSLNLTPGDLQFVTNTGSVWAGTTSFSGTAIENGGNIPVIVQDDYDVWFNDLTGHYIMIPLNL